MVASQNVDFGGANGLANFLQDQQRQIDELGRQSKYPFSAGPAGTFQIYPDPTIVDANGKPVVDTVLKYETGTPAISIRPGPAKFGSKQQMVMNDLAGNVMYATDENAGYGLSAPVFNYTLGVGQAGGAGASNAAGVEVSVAECNTAFFNTVIYGRALVVVTGTWTARYVVTDGTNTITSTTSSLTGTQYIQKIILLPANFINNTTTTLKLLVTPGTTGSTVVYPGTCVGRGKSFYDNNPSFQ